MLGRCAVCLTQQGNRLTVVLAIRVQPEAGAAYDIRGSDTGEDTQRYVDIGDFDRLACVVCYQAGGVEELAGLAHAATANFRGA